MRYTIKKSEDNASTQKDSEEESNSDKSIKQMHDIIAQIGHGIAEGQRMADMTRMEQQITQLRLERTGKIPKNILSPPSAFSIPKVSIDLSMQITTRKSKVDNETLDIIPKLQRLSSRKLLEENSFLNSNVQMTLVAIPPPEELISTEENNIPKLTDEQVANIVKEDLLAVYDDNNIADDMTLNLFFRKDAARWLGELINNEEIIAVASVNDSTGEIEFVEKYNADQADLREPSDSEEVVITKISPNRVLYQDKVTISGKNLGAGVSWMTELLLYPYKEDGGTHFEGARNSSRPIKIALSQITQNEISFIVDENLVSGWLRVRRMVRKNEPEAPVEWAESNSLPLFVEATPLDIEPPFGSFDIHKMEGSHIIVVGKNMHASTKLRFNSRDSEEKIEVERMPIDNTAMSTTQARYRVPKSATRGAITLSTVISMFQPEISIKELTEPEFFLKPTIGNIRYKDGSDLYKTNFFLIVTPNKELVFTGRNLDEISSITIGTSPNLSPTEIDEEEAHFMVPENIGDGKLKLNCSGTIFSTDYFFFQAPEIISLRPEGVEFSDEYTTPSSVAAKRGERIYIRGRGFGSNALNLRVRFYDAAMHAVDIQPDALRKYSDTNTLGLQKGQAEIVAFIPENAYSSTIVGVVRVEANFTANAEDSIAYADSNLTLT